MREGKRRRRGSKRKAPGRTPGAFSFKEDDFDAEDLAMLIEIHDDPFFGHSFGNSNFDLFNGFSFLKDEVAGLGIVVCLEPGYGFGFVGLCHIYFRFNIHVTIEQNVPALSPKMGLFVRMAVPTPTAMIATMDTVDLEESS